MKTSGIVVACALALAGTAAADPWKDKGGHGRWTTSSEHDADYGWRRDRDRYDYKRQFTSGGCTVTREWDGEKYRQDIDCKPGRLPKPYVFRRY